MTVLINKKRCDNANICPCIEACPTKAFFWNEEQQSVAVNNSLCINCRQCVIACEAGAVKVARDEEEYQKIKTEYDEDIMTVEELFQDRYGASIVEEKYSLDFNQLNQLIKDSNKLLLIEFYNDDESRCLINSILINEIIEIIDSPVSYRKINITDINMLKQYDIKTLPSLLILSNEKLIFKYDDFLDVENKEELFEKLKEVK